MEVSTIVLNAKTFGSRSRIMPCKGYLNNALRSVPELRLYSFFGVQDNTIDPHLIDQ